MKKTEKERLQDPLSNEAASEMIHYLYQMIDEIQSRCYSAYQHNEQENDCLLENNHSPSNRVDDLYDPIPF